MSKNNATASQAIIRNEKLQCDVRSCGSSRYGLSRYCLKHKERDIRYGSPTGFSFMLNGREPRYKNELTYTHNLLISNSTSKPVQAACNILLEWINAAKGGFNIAGGNLLSHINDAESVCLPILEDLSAAYIHALEVKSLSDRELTYALANSLYRHVPRKYKTIVNVQGKVSKRPTVKMGAKARLAIGEHVRKELGIFLANVHAHWKTQTDRANKRKHDLMEPIVNM